jgi:hypothetical protein
MQIYFGVYFSAKLNLNTRIAKLSLITLYEEYTV